MSSGEPLSISVDGAETTVSFARDDLNETDAARRISSDLCDLIERRHASDQSIEGIVLDFRNIDRLGSAGLNGLIGLNRKTRSQGVRLVLSNVQASVRDVFAITRLERMFEFRSGDEATVHFS